MKNPPSFQFYPQDFLSDLNVQSMTDVEVGRYIKLLCHCWIEDGLKIKGGSPLVDEWLKQGPSVARCFIKKDGKYRNPRLDRERQKQITWREKSSIGGHKSAEKKRLLKGGSTNGQPKSNQESTLPLQSSSLIKKDLKRDLLVPFELRHLELAKFLEGKIRENVPYHKFTGTNYLESWAREFRLMEDRDKIPFRDIKSVLERCLEDEFWRINILSAGTFREKFGRLAAKVSGNNRRDPDPPQTGASTQSGHDIFREAYEKNKAKERKA